MTERNDIPHVSPDDRVFYDHMVDRNDTMRGTGVDRNVAQVWYATSAGITKAVKHSKDKLRVDLVPVPGINAAARAFTAGVLKYGPHNWSNGEGLEIQDLYRATLNHVLEYGSGKLADEQTGLCPLDHAIASLMQLIATKEKALHKCRSLKEMHNG